jgi:hypothetical protein
MKLKWPHRSFVDIRHVFATTTFTSRLLRFCWCAIIATERADVKHEQTKQKKRINDGIIYINKYSFHHD